MMLYHVVINGKIYIGLENVTHNGDFTAIHSFFYFNTIHVWLLQYSFRCIKHSWLCVVILVCA